MKKWPVILCAVLLGGLLLSLWGNDYELGDGYYYLPAYEALDVGGTPMVYKSTQRDVFSDIKIEGDLRGVKANRQFVLAVRQPPASPVERVWRPAPFNGKGLQYFILVKTSDAVYGPYDWDKYAQQRTRLGVPQDLQVEAK